MEIVGDNQEQELKQEKGEPSKFDETVKEVFGKAAEAKAEAVKKEDPFGDGQVDVAEHVNSNPRLKAASSIAPFSLGAEKDEASKRAMSTVTDAHKQAFIESVVSGGRYTETFDLFNGRLHIKIRCRSVAETDAIDAYTRRKIVTSELKTDAEYSALMRILLVMAQTAEINGVEYAEMKGPYKVKETKEGLTPPGWEEDLKVWESKPESLISAITGAIIEFEARYWYMISKASDENFWRSGESTGE